MRRVERIAKPAECSSRSAGFFLRTCARGVRAAVATKTSYRGGAVMSSIRRTVTICTGLVVGALASGAVAARPPAPECEVIGVWELVGVKNNGSPVPMAGWAQRKVVTRGQFMWLGQAARRDTLPLKTAT